MQPSLDLYKATVSQFAEGERELLVLEDSVGSDAEPFRLADLDAIESDIMGVAGAIEALDNGTYGRCGFCDSELSAAELAVDPLATRCGQHR